MPPLYSAEYGAFSHSSVTLKVVYDCMAFSAGPPYSAEEALDLFEQGKLSPAETFSVFRRLENNVKRPAPQLATPTQRVKAEEHDEEADRLRRLKQVEDDLKSLIGLKSVKKLVKEVQAFVQIQQRRTVERLVSEPLVLHMIFKGNPGTGKTTVARLFGRLFKEMQVLPRGHLTETERADLVGEYIGHTAQRTREQLKKAMGGILFIDEAYSLARGGEKDFGKEAIDTLVRAMEEHRDDLILTLAGYKEEMDWFLRQNPGLRSRFPLHLTF